MLTVSELARQGSVTPETVRYYIRKGLLKAVRDPANGYNLFDTHQVARLRFINKAKRLGYTLNEIGQIIEDSSSGTSPCATVRTMIQARIEQNRQTIAQLQALQQRMEHAVATWNTMPDGTPEGESICCLIESIADLCEPHE